MRCSGCGRCCRETEMELSSDNIKKLTDAGYELCPMRHTVSKGEFKRKAKILKELLERRFMG